MTVAVVVGLCPPEVDNTRGEKQSSSLGFVSLYDNVLLYNLTMYGFINDLLKAFSVTA